MLLGAQLLLFFIAAENSSSIGGAITSLPM
jgi:hypothetical protein